MLAVVCTVYVCPLVRVSGTVSHLPFTSSSTRVQSALHHLMCVGEESLSCLESPQKPFIGSQSYDSEERQLVCVPLCAFKSDWSARVYVCDRRPFSEDFRFYDVLAPEYLFYSSP